MKLRSILKLKKTKIGIGATCIVLLATAGIAVWSNAQPPTGSCFASGSALLVGRPDTIQASVEESYGVVVGTILSDSSFPRLRVTEVIKGRALHKGDVLQLCETTRPINFINNNHTLLVFLTGKDKDYDAWALSWENTGIIPQDKDGQFNQEREDGSKTSATAEELKKLVK
jgi:hypothetical protein